jgi:broad-specificity NMP kinase
MRVALVGICGSGKTTLATGLRSLGFEVRECAQEHSEVPHMWQAISRPDVLIYLDASQEVAEARGQHHAIPDFVRIERQRLSHALEHCDLYIMTDGMTPEQVLHRSLDFFDSLERPPMPPFPAPDNPVTEGP